MRRYRKPHSFDLTVRLRLGEELVVGSLLLFETRVQAMFYCDRTRRSHLVQGVSVRRAVSNAGRLVGGRQR